MDTLNPARGGDILAPAKHNACCGSGNSGGPTVDDQTLKTKTTDAAIAQCRIMYLGLSPSEIQSLKEQMWSGDDGMVKQNQLGASTDQLASQGCTQVRPTLRQIMIRNFAKRFSDTKTNCEEDEIGPRCEGVVAVCPPQNTGETYRSEVREYVLRVNQSLPPGKYWTRTPVPSDLRKQADAAKESFLRSLRSANPDEFQRYQGKDAGHVPDTTWSGVATTGNWMPLTASVNRSIWSAGPVLPLRVPCSILH